MNYVKKRMCVDEIRLFQAAVRVVFVKSGLISEGLYPSLHVFDEALKALGAWQTEKRVLHKQRAYARQKVETQTKLLNSFAFI